MQQEIFNFLWQLTGPFWFGGLPITQCSNVYPYCHIMLSRKFVPGRKYPLKDTHMEKLQDSFGLFASLYIFYLLIH